MAVYTVARGLGPGGLGPHRLACRDEPLAHWAAVICALSVGIVAQCFGYNPFISPGGVQFWVLAAALHAASRQGTGDGGRGTGTGGEDRGKRS